MKCFRFYLLNRQISHKNFDFLSFFYISLDTTGYNISRKRFQLSTGVTVASCDSIFVSANFEFTGVVLFYLQFSFQPHFHVSHHVAVFECRAHLSISFSCFISVLFPSRLFR